MKIAGGASAASAQVAEGGGADRTRDAVARLILERGPQSAAQVADAFGDIFIRGIVAAPDRGRRR